MAYTKDILQHMAGNGRQIVLATYSYGGIVGAGAVKCLRYSPRSKASVIMVVWMAAFANPKGQSLPKMLGGDWLPWCFQMSFYQPLVNHVLTIKLR